MEDTTESMAPKPSAAGRWRRVRWICIVLLSVILVLMAFHIRNMLDRANWSEAIGHMSHMALVLTHYENEHGALPPLSIQGADGKPIHSWRGVILQYVREPNIKYVGPPYFEVEESRDQIDFFEPWDSKGNEKIFAGCFFYMKRFGVDTSKEPLRTKMLAYIGEQSIWTKEGIPKGRVEEHLDTIWFIWVEKSDLHPMQPGDINDVEIRKRLENGEDVLYGAAYGSPRKFGRVVLKEGKLEFLPNSESWK